MSKASPTQTKRRTRYRYLRADILTLLVIVGLLSAVYVLPADTSLSEVQRIGTLKACVPQSYPPLVTGSADQPGFDISLLQMLAERMDLRLALNTNPLMGRDFNPRNWRITRAQCEILAGGVLTTPTTQSFLETLSTGLATGWAVVLPLEKTLVPGARVGVFPGLGGLDRLALSGYLREQGMQGALQPSLAALEQSLASGQIDAAATEALGAGQLIKAHPDWTVAWLPDEPGRASLGLGLWKGDLTLKRAVSAALETMEADGTMAALRERYDIVPITATASLGP